jgi:hypothetical protein
MTRIVSILVGLVVGLVGLFMSVCGGGFLASMGYSTWRSLFGAQRDPSAANGLFVLLLPAGSLALGIVVCRFAYQILRDTFNDK